MLSTYSDKTMISVNKWYVSNAVIPGNVGQEMTSHSNWKFHSV